MAGTPSSITGSGDFRAGAANSVSTAWAQVVRGGSSNLRTAPAVVVVEEGRVAAAAGNSSPLRTNGSDGNGSNAGMNQARSNLSNGDTDLSFVIGADSRPALSDSGNIPSNSSDSLTSQYDGMVSVSQGIEIAAHPQSEQAPNSIMQNSLQNHAIPTHQESTRDHGVTAVANVDHTQQAPLPNPIINNASNNGSFNTPNGQTRAGSGSGFHSRGGHNQSSPHRSDRRGGYGGPSPRGNDYFNQNYRGRQDQAYAHYHWNPQKQPIGRTMNYMGPIPQHYISPGAAPYGNPMHMGSYVSPTGYYGFQTYQVPRPALEPPPRGVLNRAPMPNNHDLYSNIVKQIDYYFSENNLAQDFFLRANMDGQGWVSIDVIAKFPRIQAMTQSIPDILSAIRNSDIVEVQGRNLRNRVSWARYLPTPELLERFRNLIMQQRQDNDQNTHPRSQ